MEGYWDVKADALLYFLVKALNTWAGSYLGYSPMGREMTHLSHIRCAVVLRAMVCVLSNSYGEILTPNMMVLGGGIFESYCHKAGDFMNGISVTKKTPLAVNQTEGLGQW